MSTCLIWIKFVFMYEHGDTVALYTVKCFACNIVILVKNLQQIASNTFSIHSWMAWVKNADINQQFTMATVSMFENPNKYSVSNATSREQCHVLILFRHLLTVVLFSMRWYEAAYGLSYMVRRPYGFLWHGTVANSQHVHRHTRPIFIGIGRKISMFLSDCTVLSFYMQQI